MSETGLVISADKDTVTIKMKRGSACGKCRICVPMGEQEMVMTAQNLCGAVAGDHVQVTLQDGILIRAALLMYGLPIVALVVGALIGSAVFGDGLGTLLPAAALTAAVFFIIRGTERRRERQATAMPMAVAVVDGSDDESV